MEIWISVREPITIRLSTATGKRGHETDNSGKTIERSMGLSARTNYCSSKRVPAIPASQSVHPATGKRVMCLKNTCCVRLDTSITPSFQRRKPSGLLLNSRGSGDYFATIFGSQVFLKVMLVLCSRIV